MKKSTLLSLATAGAIVATSAGTYAAWDTTTASSTSKAVQFRQPVTVKVPTDYTFNTPAKGVLNELPTATGEVTFVVENPGDLANTLTIVPSVVESGALTTADFDFNIVETSKSDAGSHSLVRSGNGQFVDKTLNTTAYTITVTPKNDKVADIAGQDVKIQVTATLTKE